MRIEDIETMSLDIGQPMVERSAQARETAERLLQGLAALTGSHAFVLRVPEHQSNALRLLVATGLCDSQRARIELIPGRCGVCRVIMAEAQAVRSSDSPCQCSRVLSESAGAPLKVTAVPIRVRNEFAGVLSVFRQADASEPVQEGTILQTLAAAADLLAGSLEEAALGEADFYAGLMLQRHLIANEVHDSLAQNLTSIRMRTALLRDALDKNDRSRSAAYLGEIDQSLASAQSRVRELITDFRSQLGATQLVPALEEEIGKLRNSTNAQIEFVNKAREPQLSAFEQVQVFYIAREALTNALKHAQPTCINVSLKESEGEFFLCVEDNGSGLACDARGGNIKHGHYGMEIMQERAARIGGHIEFLIPPGGGTCVRLRFPSRGNTLERSQP
jgi:nitrate/nitrite-specific signal transduction histidine kinase